MMPNLSDAAYDRRIFTDVMSLKTQKQTLRSWEGLMFYLYDE